MSKKVYRDAKIILGGVDVSDDVTRWAITAEIGELYTAEIDLMKTDRLKIRKRGKYGFNGMRYTSDDLVTVDGVDISKWIYRYYEVSHVREYDEVRLFLQCDKEVLSINGTHPWEEPE